MAAVIVLVTYPTDQDPLPLARTLVDEQLVACVNVLPPMQSVYRWEGKIEQAAEHQLVMKTTHERVKALEARLVDLHPYDVPEVLVLPISGGGEAYLNWLAASVRDL
ncbi:MAG TPA: divalent-cation tolerance protein CutA [Vicinamibacterales bacterium]|nr:divalent-cation tolerance protein CutA [Vicinamibacterales bacterium]